MLEIDSLSHLRFKQVIENYLFRKASSSGQNMPISSLVKPFILFIHFPSLIYLSIYLLLKAILCSLKCTIP